MNIRPDQKGVYTESSGAFLEKEKKVEILDKGFCVYGNQI